MQQHQQQQQQQQQQQHYQLPHTAPVQPQPPYMMQGPEARPVQLQGGGAGAHLVYHQLHPMQHLQQQQPQPQQYVQHVIHHPQQGHPSIMIQQPPMMGMQQQQHQHHAHHQQQPQYYQQQPSPQQPPPLQQQPQPQSPWVPGVGKVDISLSGDLEEFSELFGTGSGLIGDGGFMPMTSTSPGQGPIGTRKRARKIEMVTKSATDEEINLRKERNKVHAKRSRLRRKFLLESLRDQLLGLRRENTSLRQIVKQRCGQKAPEIFEKCCTDLSPMLADVLRGTGEGEDGQDAAAMHENDQKLMLALQKAQQSFTVCSATSPGNTIIFASEGFLKLTGYTLDQVVGRPALFLKGVGTSDKDVEMVNKGIAEGRDTTVCLLNYKADGTAFWNQMFVAPLCDAQDNPIYFVGVHCDIEECPLDDELQNVVKKTSVDVMEKSLFGK